MNKVISFCLYGNSPIYLEGAIYNLKLSKKIYPGWSIRFYIANDVNPKIIKKIKDKGGDVFPFEIEEGMNPMMTRFLPLMDTKVDIWISRDCDSRINWREKCAVDEWIESEKTFHLMRDSHNHYYPIMGGMFGVKNYLLIEKNISVPKINLFYSEGNDQKFLENHLWGIFCRDLLCHDTWSHNLPKEEFLTVQEGDLVHWNQAYGVGLINFLKEEKNRIFENILKTDGQTNKDFPKHKKISPGIFVGQRIDERNKPIINMDSRWEYEIRGLSNG